METGWRAQRQTAAVSADLYDWSLIDLIKVGFREI
jgi:hypothetical protein